MKEFSLNNNLEFIGTYANGQKVEKVLNIIKDRKKKEGAFLKGKRYGCGKEYSLDGITRFECKFLYGVKCGYDKVFESGILVFKGELLNN